jgi:hypothetical protein
MKPEPPPYRNPAGFACLGNTILIYSLYVFSISTHEEGEARDIP